MRNDARGGASRHFNYSNVMSTLAVFLVLTGGVAVAATVESSKDIPAQTIKNSDVKQNTLKSNRLKDGKAVSGTDVIDDSLAGTDIDESSLGKVGSAASADSATNAEQLGGDGASTYAKRMFARVSYSDANTTPDVTASSGGISGNGESFEGAPRLTFPQNMSSCAITANVVSGGPKGMVRQSTLSSGNVVVLVIENENGTAFRANYNVIAQC